MARTLHQSVLVMQRAPVLVAIWACLGCGDPRADELPARDAASQTPAEDHDADGLCDATEIQLGTDPERADSDGDGLLDGHELIAGTDPRDRNDPGADHIVFLQRGSSEDFSLSLSVDGSGSHATGTFSDRNAFDTFERRASAFYRGSTAGMPVDAAPGLTRLQFSLHFAADSVEEDTADAGALSSNAASGCAAVLPFDYAATSNDGTELTQERFVLIVVMMPDASPPLTAAEFCLPAACL